jgi:hypothetical protein
MKKIIKRIKIKRLNLKKQLNECSGFFPLISNPGADTSSRVSLCVSALLNVGMLGCVSEGVVPPY